MNKKSMLDQILDILEKWEEEIPVEKPRQESSFSNQKKSKRVGRKEKTMLLLWTLFCFVILMMIPYLLADVRLEIDTVLNSILNIVVHFILFTPVLYWYLNLVEKDKKWILLSIFPFFSFIFVIYLVGLDQTDKKTKNETSLNQNTSAISKVSVSPKKHSFFDFTPDDRFKR